MKKYSIWPLFFIIFSNSFCGIIKYEGKKLNISKKIFVLEDKTKSLKEEDIIKGLHNEKFIINKGNVLYLDNSNSIYYIKLDVQNLTSKNCLSVYGWFGPISLLNSQISLIYIEKNTLIKEKFNRKIHEKDRNSLLNYGHGKFSILPNEVKTIYIKSNGYPVTPIFLTEVENIIEEERLHIVITNIFNGISLLVLLTILGLFLRVRKIYLLHYILIFIFTYTKSNLFIRFLRNSVPFDIEIIYTISVMCYVFFLVKFVSDILKLDKKYKNIQNYLNFISYITLLLGFSYLFNLIDLDYLFQHIRYVYITTFTLILYAATKRYKDGWLYKAFLFIWIPQWLLYVYLFAVDPFKLYTTFFDVRTFEYLEIFANLLIAGILVYDSKELWRGKNTVKDQEEFIKIINGTDNLMHGLLTLINAYKHDIDFNRVMFFRRKIDRENDEILYYDFSIPLTLYEKENEKKYFDLAKYLNQNRFNEYYICDDIQSNELYKPLLPEYKSLIALKLKFVEGIDLGYILILNENNVEYEYNEIMKDFKYKSSLLVQYFKTIDDIRDKYGSVIVEETLRNFHIEVLKDAEKDVNDTLTQLDKIRTISDKYVEDNDPSVKRVLNLFYSNLEKLMISIKKDLIFDNPDKKTKKKIMFTYGIIEEMFNYLKDIVRKSSNKLNIVVTSQIHNDYKLFGHIKIVRSLINHLITYLYDKIIKHNTESTITVVTSLEEGKLKIDTKIEGIYIELEKLKKEYNIEVHRVLLNSIRSKLELKSNDNIIHIIYYMNILTKEEKKKFNIEHLDYDEDKN